MSLLKIMLLVTAVASVGYAIGLLVPDLYPAPEVGPEGVAWARYLAPIYLGLGVVAWLAFRRPTETAGIAWALVLLWGGLVVVHVVNMALGDEEPGVLTVGLAFFDAIMGGLLLAGILREGRTGPSRSQGHPQK